MSGFLPNGPRDTWLDVLRGFAIVLVVVGHTLRGLEASGEYAHGIFAFLDVRLYAVHVQLLFFVSGLLVSGSLERRGIGRFTATRFSDLLLPMIIWTYVFLAVKVLAGPYQNAPEGPEILLRSPIPGQLHLWFLWALFLHQFAVIAIWATARASWRPWVVLLLLVASLMLADIRISGSLVPWIGSFLHYLPFFLLGLLFALFRVPHALGRGAGAVGAGVFLAAFLFAPAISAAAGSVLPVSLLACLGAYFASGAVEGAGRLRGALAYVGLGSMAVYVLHTIFSAAVREVLFEAGVTSLGFQVPLGVLAGIGLPLMVRRAARRSGVARVLAL